MRVSFDLDEVLFVSPENHKVEPQPRFPLSAIYKERLGEDEFTDLLMINFAANTP